MFPNSPNARLLLLVVTSSYDEIGNKKYVVESQKEVIGSVSSLTTNQYKSSLEIGKNVEFKVSIQSILFDGSKYVSINGEIFLIERTFQNGQFIELYLSKSDVEVNLNEECST